MLIDTFFFEMLQPTSLREAQDAKMENSLNTVDMMTGSVEEAEDNVKKRKSVVVEMSYSMKS